MKRIGLRIFWGWFGALDIQIDDDRLLAASDYDRLYRLVPSSVQLLMRDERRHINEISGTGFLHEFQVRSPAKARAASNDVENCFQFPVVMRPSARIRMNNHRARPELFRTCASVGDRSSAGHAGRLRRIAI